MISSKQNPPALDDFKRHLIASGKAAATVCSYVTTVRRFLNHIGETPLDRLTENQVRAYFTAIKNPSTRMMSATCVQRFLKFSAARLPAVVDNRGSKAAPGARPRSEKEITLQRQWSADKLVEQKEKADNLIAQLARKVIDHYLYFQGRMKGEPENLDDVYRMAGECKELIERNLTLFMGLSAEGRNVHSKIDERVQL